MIEEFKAQHNDVQELSLDDPANVAGGVPEVFDCGGVILTQDELYQLVHSVHNACGESVAHDFLSTMLRSAGYEFIDEAIEAYNVYGENMWKRLRDLGM